LTATDASLHFDVSQALAVLTAGFQLAVPSHDQLTVVDTPAELSTLTQQQIGELEALGFTGLATRRPGYVPVEIVERRGMSKAAQLSTGLRRILV
jgi:hypothetical protein